MANPIVTRNDITRLVAKELGETISTSEAIIAKAFEHIQHSVEEGNDVRIHGFGTFKRKDRAERQGRNPSTGEPMTIKASSSIVFKQTKRAK
jgi:DNA-binding protein HU-beta